VASERHLLFEGIVGAAFRLPIHAAPGKTLDLGPPDQTMATLCVTVPLGGILLGAGTKWSMQEVEWCSSTTSTTPSLVYVAQRGLGDGRARLDSHRVGAPSGVVVASMASLVRGSTSV
jgi:hypothetical protein